VKDDVGLQYRILVERDIRVDMAGCAYFAVLVDDRVSLNHDIIAYPDILTYADERVDPYILPIRAEEAMDAFGSVCAGFSSFLLRAL